MRSFRFAFAALVAVAAAVVPVSAASAGPISETCTAVSDAATLPPGTVTSAVAALTTAGDDATVEDTLTDANDATMALLAAATPAGVTTTATALLYQATTAGPTEVATEAMDLADAVLATGAAQATAVVDSVTGTVAEATTAACATWVSVYPLCVETPTGEGLCTPPIEIS